MSDLPRIRLAGVSLPYRLRFPGGKAFAEFEEDGGPEPAAPVCISDSDWEYYRGEGYLENAQVEYSLLTAHFSDALLAYDRVILHAVALRRRDRAWLICGKSGVGKSTQARCLQELRPGEFGIISGDRPILQFCHSERSEESVSPVPQFCHSERSEESVSPIPQFCHSERSEESVSPVPLVPPVTPSAAKNPVPPFPSSLIIVHPSPWNGKENWYGAEAAPLAGLILLERGDENRLCTLNPREAALTFYSQIIQTSATADGVRKAAELATRLLNAVPIWKLTTYQVPDSTKLLLNAVFSEE